MIYEYPFPMPYHVTKTIEPYNKQADFSHSHATLLRFSTFYFEKMTYFCHLSLTASHFSWLVYIIIMQTKYFLSTTPNPNIKLLDSVTCVYHSITLKYNWSSFARHTLSKRDDFKKFVIFANTKTVKNELENITFIANLGIW